MIAIGGSIGAGLFVGAGGALTSGGPGSLIIDFMIIGFMLLMTVNALGELAGMIPPILPKLSSNTNIWNSSLPCRRFFLHLLSALHRSCLGIRYGLELCDELVGCAAL